MLRTFLPHKLCTTNDTHKYVGQWWSTENFSGSHLISVAHLFGTFHPLCRQLLIWMHNKFVREQICALIRDDPPKFVLWTFMRAQLCWTGVIHRTNIVGNIWPDQCRTPVDHPTTSALHALRRENNRRYLWTNFV